MKTASILVLAAVLGTAACKPAADKTAKVDSAAEETSIRAKETGWMDAYNKRDAGALAGQYADDAAIANPGVALATDAASRRAFLDGVVSDPALKIDFASDRIIFASSGDLASSRGHYTMTYTDSETKKPKTEKGSYLTVYRKDADGSWKAVEDFITPGPPAAAAAQ
jgi:ketosteroid isomerase-like protein